MGGNAARWRPFHKAEIHIPGTLPGFAKFPYMSNRFLTALAGGTAVLLSPLRAQDASPATAWTTKASQDLEAGKERT
jgi:hypothetical protein